MSYPAWEWPARHVGVIGQSAQGTLIAVPQNRLPGFASTCLNWLAKVWGRKSIFFSYIQAHFILTFSSYHIHFVYTLFFQRLKLTISWTLSTSVKIVIPSVNYSTSILYSHLPFSMSRAVSPYRNFPQAMAEMSQVFLNQALCRTFIFSPANSLLNSYPLYWVILPVFSPLMPFLNLALSHFINYLHLFLLHTQYTYIILHTRVLCFIYWNPRMHLHYFLHLIIATAHISDCCGTFHAALMQDTLLYSHVYIIFFQNCLQHIF